jgi:hypothetical protein
MKKLLFVVAILGLTASLSAQSLVELAKLERARRAKYDGRHAPVITSRELALIKKSGAVEVTRPEGADWAQGSEQDPEAATVTYDGGLLNPPSGQAPAGEPGAASDDLSQSLPQDGQALADQLRAVDALVESLTGEMNALRQRFESQNGMVPGYVLQEQMDATSQRLDRAQARQAAIEARMTELGLPVRKRPEPVGR